MKKCWYNRKNWIMIESYWIKVKARKMKFLKAVNCNKQGGIELKLKRLEEEVEKIR